MITSMRNSSSSICYGSSSNYCCSCVITVIAISILVLGYDESFSIISATIVIEILKLRSLILTVIPSTATRTS